MYRRIEGSGSVQSGQHVVTPWLCPVLRLYCSRRGWIQPRGVYIDVCVWFRTSPACAWSQSSINTLHMILSPYTWYMNAVQCAMSYRVTWDAQPRLKQRLIAANYFVLSLPDWLRTESIPITDIRGTARLIFPYFAQFYQIRIFFCPAIGLTVTGKRIYGINILVEISVKTI